MMMSFHLLTILLSIISNFIHAHAFSQPTLIQRSLLDDKELDLLNLSSKQIDTLYNTIVTQVYERIHEEKPKDNYQYMKILFEEITALCHESEFDCKDSVYRELVHGKKKIKKLLKKKDFFIFDDLFPNLFDGDLKEDLKIIFDVVSLIKTYTPNEIIDVLNNISLKIEDSDFSKPKKKLLLSVIKIIVGSMNLWTNVLIAVEQKFRKTNYNRLLEVPAPQTDEEIKIRTYIYENMIVELIGAIGSLTKEIEIPTPLITLRTSLAWTLALLGQYIPFPQNFVACLYNSKFNDDPEYVESEYALPPPECDESITFGPTVASILNLEDRLRPIKKVVERLKNRDEEPTTVGLYHPYDQEEDASDIAYRPQRKFLKGKTRKHRSKDD